MLIAGYYGLLRAGEMVMGPHVLLAKDVHIGKNKNKFLFILWSSKTHDKSSKPQMIKISSVPTGSQSHNRKHNKLGQTAIHNYCPFEMLRKYIAIRPEAITTNEQFFVYGDNLNVTPTKLCTVLKLIKLQCFSVQSP